MMHDQVTDLIEYVEDIKEDLSEESHIEKAKRLLKRLRNNEGRIKKAMAA